MMMNKTEVKIIAEITEDLPVYSEHARENSKDKIEYATYLFKDVFPIVARVLENEGEISRNQAIFVLTKIDYKIVARDLSLLNRVFSMAEIAFDDENHLVRENAMVVLIKMVENVSTEKRNIDELLIKIFKKAVKGLTDEDSFVIGKSARVLNCVGERIIEAGIILDNPNLKEIVGSIIESLDDGWLEGKQYPLLVGYGSRALLELMLVESKREGISLLEIYKKHFGK